MTRYYCTIDDMISVSPLGFKRESVALDALDQATRFLEGKKQLNGLFMPVLDTRSFDGSGDLSLFLRDYLLSITTITHDGTTLSSSDYVKYPLNAHWENGPYTRLAVDPDSSNLSTWKLERDVVSIVGSFGKYSETRATGETITLNNSQTDLKVANGANISVGMILLIESEQLAVKATGATTAATSKVNGAIAASDTIITVDNGAEFNELEILKIDLEQMRILDIATNNLYVDRAYNGTRAAAHIDDSAIAVYRTYTVERGANGTTAAAHTTKAISRYVAPMDVTWLTKQIAGLMLKKAESHYAGKIGNAELGEVFYLNEFPTMQIAETRQNYRINLL